MRTRIQKLLDERVNPMVSQHGGYIELVDYANRTAFIAMNGGCQGCSASQATLRDAVERSIFEAFPRVQKVVDVTDHNAGENHYFS